MSSAKGKTTYQKQLRGGRDPKAGRQIGRRDGVDNSKTRALGDAIDAKFGFLKFEEVSSQSIVTMSIYNICLGRTEAWLVAELSRHCTYFPRR